MKPDNVPATPAARDRQALTPEAVRREQAFRELCGAWTAEQKAEFDAIVRVAFESTF